MADPQTLSKQITETRQRLAELEYALSRAQQEAVVQAAATANHRKVAEATVARLRSGAYVTGIQGRMWWFSRDGRMIDRATADEMQAVESLRSRGVVEFRSWEVSHG